MRFLLPFLLPATLLDVFCRLRRRARSEMPVSRFAPSLALALLDVFCRLRRRARSAQPSGFAGSASLRVSPPASLASPLAPSLALALLACADKDTGESGPVDSGEDDSPWSIVAEGIGDAMLLAAWEDQGELLIVGGDLADGGHGSLLRYDGETICAEQSVTEDAALWWIHGAGADKWYAVGAGGAVVTNVGDQRGRDDVDTTATLFGVWDAGTAVWAVGGDVDANTGGIWRNTGAQWEIVADGLPGVIFKVWGDDQGDLWFVGDEQAYRWQGDPAAAGELVESTTDQRLVTVRGRSADDVWAVGGTSGSAVVKWDGAAWAEQDTTYLSSPLNGVWTAEGDEVWVTGNAGAMAYNDGERWQIPDFPMTSDHFHAVARFGDEVLFVGGDFFDAGDNHGVIGRYGDAPSEADWTLVSCE